MEQCRDKEKINQMLTELKQKNDSCHTWELLNPVYGELCKAIGPEAAIEIYLLFGGQQLSFPCSFYKPSYIKECVIREFNGSNLRQLSKKYNRSEKTIRRFLQEGRSESCK